MLKVLSLLVHILFFILYHLVPTAALVKNIQEMQRLTFAYGLFIVRQATLSKLIFNRPGVAGAVLQSPPSLTD